MLTRRNVLIGLGVAGAGTLAVLDNFTDVLDGTSGSDVGPENPPLTNPNDGNNTGTDEPAFQTPWNKDSLVISVEWNEQDSTDPTWFENGFDDQKKIGAYDVLQNAVAFWNDYIKANAAFDLTLTFEPNTSNADIMLQQATTTVAACSGQYKGPETLDDSLQTEVCAETLTETPAEDDLPVTGVLAMGSRGQAVYQLVAQHTIGRLLGYDIWSDPVHVMTPKITFSPATRNSPRSRQLLQKPSIRDKNRHEFAEIASNPEKLDKIRNPKQATAQGIEGLRGELQDGIAEFIRSMNEWLALVEEVGPVPLYAEAYEETILNEDIAYVQKTVALITEILDTYSQDEIADGPDELSTLGDRLETISNWPENTDPYDLRIHLYFTDKVWSAWAAEQTPTATDSA